MELPGKIRIAICSPARNAYSETFIHAHKNRLDGSVFYYFNGFIPADLEGIGKLNLGVLLKIRYFIFHYLGVYNYSFQEFCLENSFKRNRIMIVLAEYGYVGAEVLNVCKNLRLPLIVHFHGGDASHTGTLEKYQSFYHEMFSYAKCIIAVSGAMVEKLQQIGCPKEKIIYNPYGPDPVFLENNPKYEKDIFVSVGRFVDKKAPYYVILAFREVAREYPHSVLKMIGDGPLYQVCKDLAGYFNLEKNIEFAGVKDIHGIKSTLEESLAFIQHSKVALDGDSEGTPVAVLEAQAAALPVISTKHGGIMDIVLNNITGILVDENDVESMAGAIKEMIRNKEMAREMGKKGRERILHHFTMDRHIEKINTIIREHALK